MNVSYPSTWGGLRPALRQRIDDALHTLRAQAEIGLHLGSGAVKIPGLINCDLYDPSADRKVDCLDLADFEDGTVDLIETHHMLEHLDFEEADRALREWHRALRLGGHLIITCPNITHVALRWLVLSALPWRGAKAKRDYALKMLYGPQNGGGMVHKSGYDASMLATKLRQHGFDIEFSHTPYPARPTPSLLMIAKKRP